MDRNIAGSEASSEPALKNKLEINIYRLLKSCEKRAESSHPDELSNDVKFYTHELEKREEERGRPAFSSIFCCLYHNSQRKATKELHPLMFLILRCKLYWLWPTVDELASQPRALPASYSLPQFVTVLKEKLAQLIDEIIPGGEALARESEYRDRISALEQKTSKQAMPDIWRPYHSPSQASESPSSPSTDGIIQSDSPLRRRNLEGWEFWGVSEREQLQLDDASRQIMERNRVLQDDLTDQLLGLAGGIKKNSLLIQDALKDSHKSLDQSQVALEHNVINTRLASNQASKAFRNSFCTGCMSWLVIIGVFGAFLGMVVLIRIT